MVTLGRRKRSFQIQILIFMLPKVYILGYMVLEAHRINEWMQTIGNTGILY